MKYFTIVALMSIGCGASYREITYPSPCSDSDKCAVTGYEIWGSDEEQIRFRAESLCDGKVHVNMSAPIHEYAVARCEVSQDPVTIIVTEEP